MEEEVVEYPHLKLRRWPFNLLPTEESIKYWAGRENIKKEVYGILRRSSRNPSARLTLLWAWFGSGKSHTLQHIEHICKDDYIKYSLFPIYTIFPGQIKSFLDLYGKIIDGINFSVVLEANKSEVPKQIKKVCSPTWAQSLTNTFRYLKHGGQIANTTLRSWLRGDKVPLVSLRAFEIDKRIESMEDSISILSAIFKLVLSFGKSKGIILMIDEFQEIGQLSSRRASELNGFIHKLFDANPSYLSLFLSFTTGDKDTINSLLGDALQNRISNAIALPEMDMEESMQFVKELVIANAAPDNPDYFPFTEDGFRAIIAFVKEDQNKFLIPREIIKAADSVLGEAEPLIEEGGLEKIDSRFVKKVLIK